MQEMKANNRISDFIGAFLRENEPLLEKIREEAQKDAVPIIRDETAALLRVCLEIHKPKRILELGTAVGYSGLFMLYSLEILERLVLEKKSFDFIFLDAAKAQYPLWLPLILELLPTGGVLFCDNILQEGLLLESRFFLERRQRTIHKRMREFLHLLRENAELESSIVPIGDGVSISVKK